MRRTGGLKELFSPFQQRKARRGRRVGRGTRVVGLESGSAVLAKDLFAQVLDADLQFPAARGAFLHKIRV
jgi:hypothetical protein